MSNLAMTTLGFHIKVIDIKRSRAFYDTLGFHRHLDYGPDTPSGESYYGTFYRIGDSALIEISDAHELVPGSEIEVPIDTAKASIFVKVPSLIPTIQAAQANGIPIHFQPCLFPWKAFEMIIRDPDGLFIFFVSQQADEDAGTLQNLSSEDIYRVPPDYSRSRRRP